MEGAGVRLRATPADAKPAATASGVQCALVSSRCRTRRAYALSHAAPPEARNLHNLVPCDFVARAVS